MKKETKEKLCKIRDFLWPMLDGEANSTTNKIDETQCSFIDEANLDKAIELALLYAKSEDERRSSVESKAALFIGTFSLAVTILIGMVKDYIFNIGSYPIELLSVVIFFTCLIIVYLCRAVLYSIQALTRKSYSAIGVPQFLYNSDKNYKVKLFITIRNGIYSNFCAINQKVDSMTMAQEFFKCAVRTAMILAGILLVFFIIA